MKKDCLMHNDVRERIKRVSAEFEIFSKLLHQIEKDFGYLIEISQLSSLMSLETTKYLFDDILYASYVKLEYFRCYFEKHAPIETKMKFNISYLIGENETLNIPTFNKRNYIIYNFILFLLREIYEEN